MIYKEIGNSGVKISVLSMGGHEYCPMEGPGDLAKSLSWLSSPVISLKDLARREGGKVLSIAYQNGINFFDVTQDSEKEALGRNLKEMPPPYEIYIQTRPEGMV